MIDRSIISIITLKLLFAGIVIMTCLFLLSLFVLAIESNPVEAKSVSSLTETRASYRSDNPNVVSSGLTNAANELDQATDSLEYEIRSGIHFAALSTVHSGKAIIHGTFTGLAAVVNTAGKGIATTGNAFAGGISFVISIPGNTMNAVLNAPVVRSVIRPTDNMEVPIIDPNSSSLSEVQTALPSANAKDHATPHNDSDTAWPIRGEITTHFGVPHWPYQPTHTGLDISDGLPSGVTPVKPFRSGRVIETIISNYGLGNHVIVDHGNGVTSVYAHLSYISVHPGQEVILDTTIGLVGSTGLSTGPHLHFEVRVDGQVVDPLLFIGSQSL